MSTPGPTPTVPALAENFLAFAVKRLQLSDKDIDACLERLSDVQFWERGGDHENSIANLLLHLEGNLRQWILHGIDNQPDIRRRDDEFTLHPTTTAAEARAHLTATIEECSHVLATLDPARLLTVIDPQPTGTWRHPTILEAIYKVVSHLDHHTGQIILLTKQLTARDLDFSMPRRR